VYVYMLWVQEAALTIVVSIVNADGTGEFDEEEVMAPTKTAPTYSDHKKNFQELERVSWSY
jgi:hypothetical protein